MPRGVTVELAVGLQADRVADVAERLAVLERLSVCVGVAVAEGVPGAVAVAVAEGVGVVERKSVSSREADGVPEGVQDRLEDRFPVTEAVSEEEHDWDALSDSERERVSEAVCVWEETDGVGELLGLRVAVLRGRAEGEDEGLRDTLAVADERLGVPVALREAVTEHVAVGVRAAVREGEGVWVGVRDGRERVLLMDRVRVGLGLPQEVGVAVGLGLTETLQVRVGPEVAVGLPVPLAVGDGVADVEREGVGRVAERDRVELQVSVRLADGLGVVDALDADHDSDEVAEPVRVLLVVAEGLSDTERLKVEKLRVSEPVYALPEADDVELGLSVGLRLGVGPGVGVGERLLLAEAEAVGRVGVGDAVGLAEAETEEGVADGPVGVSEFDPVPVRVRVTVSVVRVPRVREGLRVAEAVSGRLRDREEGEGEGVREWLEAVPERVACDAVQVLRVGDSEGEEVGVPEVEADWDGRDTVTEMVRDGVRLGVPSTEMDGDGVGLRVPVDAVAEGVPLDDEVGVGAESVSVCVPEGLIEKVWVAENVAVAVCVRCLVTEAVDEHVGLIVRDEALRETLRRLKETVAETVEAVPLLVPERVCVHEGEPVALHEPVPEGVGLRVGLQVGVTVGEGLRERVRVVEAVAVHRDGEQAGVSDSERDRLRERDGVEDEV